jgi:HSP20 family protein
MAEPKTAERTDTPQRTTSQTASTGQQQLRRRESGRIAPPFDLIDRMADEMDRTFEQFFGNWGLPRRRSWFGGVPARASSQEQGALWAPRVEAFQKGDRYVVRADLPGMKADDVRVELADDAITISGELRDEREEEREGVYLSERQYGQFYRVVPLPEGVISESADATFKNGVLEITMQAPPAETKRRRQIQVKDSSAEENQNKK